jgi:hypothetical protein
MNEARDREIIRAALLITRVRSDYSDLAWIADIRKAVSHLLSAHRVDMLLLRLHDDGEIELRRADMVQGCEDIAAESALHCLTETWHYAGPVA